MFAMAVENLIRLGRGAGIGTARLELEKRLINYLARSTNSACRAEHADFVDH
jgi:hypothetical protein